MKKNMLVLTLLYLILIITVVSWLQFKEHDNQLTANDQLTIATAESKTHYDQITAATAKSKTHYDQITADTDKSKTYDGQLATTVESKAHNDQLTAAKVQSKTHDDQIIAATAKTKTYNDKITAATVQSTTYDDQLTAATVQSKTHDDQIIASSVVSKTHEDVLKDTVRSSAALPNHGLHFVTYHHSISLASHKDASSEMLDRKMEEMYVLQKNLQHPLVTNMHIIVANKTLMEKSLRKEDVDEKKVIIYDNGRPPTMKEVFQYVSDYLINKAVVVSNGDIYLGSGFDRLNHSIMTEKRIMYALTRHQAPESNCTEVEALCSLVYGGSHDTFIFILNDPIPSEVLDELDYQLGTLGSENRLMWAFKTKLNYCLLNPCSILKSYHYHCSGVRSLTRHNRVNINGKSAMCFPSKGLLCMHA